MFARNLIDAAHLLPALSNPPCIILGLGEPSMAHQTHEYCLLGWQRRSSCTRKSFRTGWISAAAG